MPSRALATSLGDERRPLLRDLARGLHPLPGLRTTLARSFDPVGELLDTASPRLGGLRAAVRTAYDRLRRRLEQLVGSTELGGALQDSIVTLRNGRYVVPVKADARSRVKGIVHDASGSGQTLFVEPLVAVELGNAWREAQIAEQQEVDRILDELSGVVAANAVALRESLDALASFDFWAAKAQLAAEMDAVRAAPLGPPVGRAARARATRASPGRVVPIDLALGEGYSALVVTGPNTGGKTVTLRTLGLLVADEPGRAPHPGRRGLVASRSSATSSRTSATSSPSPSRSRRSAATCARSSGSSRRPAPARWSCSTSSAPAPTRRRARRSRRRCSTTSSVRARSWPRPPTTPSSRRTRTPRRRRATRRSSSTSRRSHPPTGSRSGCRAAARRSRSPSASACPTGSSATHDRASPRRSRRSSRRWRRSARRRRRRASRSSARDGPRSGRPRRCARPRRSGGGRGASATRRSAPRARRPRRLVDAVARRGPRDAPRARAPDRHGAGARSERRARRGASRAPAGCRAARPAGARPRSRSKRDWRLGERARSRTQGWEGRITALERQRAARDAGCRGHPGHGRGRRPGARRGRTARGAAGGGRGGVEQFDLGPAADRTRHVASSLDLRGARVDEALDLLGRYLEDASLAGLDKVLVIHGMGTGALRDAVRSEAGGHPLVKSVRAGERGEGGDGATIVSF